MREMKDSGIEWVGKIPCSWSTPKITHILDYRHRYPIGDGDHGSIKASEYAESGIPFIRVQNLGYATDLNTSNMVYITEKQNEGIKNSTLYPYDVLFAKTGATIGKVGMVPPSMEKANTTSHVGKITVSPKTAPRFIYYILSSYIGYKQFWDIANLKSTRPELSIDEIKTIRILLPDTKMEQEKIADYLDLKCSEIDAISADIQKEIETLEQYKRSVITEAVTKGLNPDVEMKDSGIEWVGNVPDHWGVLANKYVMKKRKDICTKWNGENVLSLTMNGVIVRDLDNPVGKMPTTFDGYQFVYSGNLLMCLFDYDVTPRCVGIVKNAGVTSPAYSRFELKENATLEYFYYYYLMIDFTKELLHLAKNLRHSFTEEQLGALKVPLPPLDEQKNIATYLDSKCKEIESVIASKKQQLEVLDSYKKSLIYEYVTGKKEVPMYES